MPTTSPEKLNWKPVPHPSPLTLTGRLVRLEPLNAAAHTPALWEEVRGHDGLWTWLGDGPFDDATSFRLGLESKEKSPDALFFALIPMSRGSAAGFASYMRMDPSNGVIEVGNILMGPSLQRTAAATEAMYLMARHIFDDLGYRRYEWKCNALNAPSRRAAERLGFTFEGVFRQHMVVKGQNRDTAWFSMLDREWAARKEALETWLAPSNFDSDGKQNIRLASVSRTPGLT